ncbi:hypothetical protein [Rubrivirga sp.]|uniref:hypothetical protein n=1 Tax=Rubrivirga sp. TaxID=1885344 RepID=UPI003C76C7ED
MANIPVERTASSPPWWLWLLGLLLLGLIGWLIASALGDDDEVVEDPVEVVDEPVAAAGLDLSDVYVTRVVGDNTFFVAPTADGDDETLVYLEEEPTPGDAVEGRYDVTEGQRISIDGEILPVGDIDVSEWGLTPDQVALVDDEYVRATSLTVLDGADDGPMTDVSQLGDLSTMVGSSVVLEGVSVTELAGDSTFYIGSGADRVLVVLEDLGESESGPGTGADGRFNIDVGDSLMLDAEVMAFTRGMRGTTTLEDDMVTDAEDRQYVLVVNERGQLTMM